MAGVMSRTVQIHGVMTNKNEALAVRRLVVELVIQHGIAGRSRTQSEMPQIVKSLCTDKQVRMGVQEGLRELIKGSSVGVDLCYESSVSYRSIITVHIFDADISCDEALESVGHIETVVTRWVTHLVRAVDTVHLAEEVTKTC